ncbi:MAG: lipopolysaccharide heptosyltransferase II [Candidatus Krumholzibacteriota bacterium]|nr:lipopolysaccharide heptosyltransferase II [Candidatus Krumholzibacteriota bacterium]
MAPNWLGDAVMATPILAVLQETGNGRSVTVGCRSYVSEIFRRHPAIDRMIVYDGDGKLSGAARALRRGRPANGWSNCIVLPPSFAAALAARLCGAGGRVGFGGAGRSLLLSRAVGKTDRGEHLSRSYVRLAEAATGRRARKIPLPVVVPPEDWRATVARNGLDRPYLAVAAGAAYGSAKRWPVKRFAAVAARAATRGFVAVALGTAGDAEALDAIAAAGGGTSLAGTLDAAGLVAVLRGAACVLGNDSGPVHIAAAMGRPTVAVFGSTSPAWTAPRGRRARVVRADLECSPCFRRECPDGEPACLDSISVDEVAGAVDAAIEEDTDE